MLAANFPRRQQYRRLRRAAGYLVATVTLGTVVAVVAGTGQLVLAAVLIVVGSGCGLRTRTWVLLANRSRIGAGSEDEVQWSLTELGREGWRVRYSLRWAGPGDIDSVAIAPTGIGFVIETKTARFDSGHLEGVAEMTRWLSRRRRSWCPNGTRAVLCVVRARHLQQTNAGVLVVSVDQLVMALRIAAGTRTRPLFLSAARSRGPQRPCPQASPPGPARLRRASGR